MRLPEPSAPFRQRVHVGRYVSRRLRRAKRSTMAADVESATAEVQKRGRELEDAALPVHDARADRDASDDDLDTLAQDARANLAGRHASANKEAPYTLIFAEGIDYYVAAPLDQETTRYGELAKRLTEHLSSDDPVRKSAVPAIQTGIDTFKSATEAVSKALTDEALASTRLTIAEEAWGRLLIKIYGLLLSELGKSEAEKFFPKLRGGKKAKKSTE